MQDDRPLNEYLALSRGQWDPDADPAAIQAAIDSFYHWYDALVAEGRIRPGHRLARDSRLVGRTGVVDGPFAEAREVIGGYWFFVAPSLDEAVALAARNPCIAFGLCFEVRPLEHQRASAYALTNETPQRAEAAAAAGAARDAVLVIDVQQGLCEGDGAAHDCAGTIARINTVTDRARAAGVPVILVQHESTAGYLEHGTPDWQLADGLRVAPGDLRLRKTTPDAFLRTDLEARLRGLGVQRLVVCGMHSEFCVDTTTRRALALGWPVTLVSDGHTSAGNAAIGAPQVIAHQNATLTDISSFGPRVSAVPADAVRFGAGT